MAPKVSVIVAVYKAEAYLHRCVDSILGQTFKDFEVLLIDDGSPDSSGEICDEYAKKDSRVRVFHKENGGVSSARNLGLDNAKSEWVTFIDADDWISNTFIDNLYEPILLDNTIEFVQAGCTNYINNEIADVEQQYKYFKSDDPVYVFNHFRGLTVSKLFSLENVIRTHGLKFDEKMHTTEDLAFTLDYIYHIKKYCFIPEVGYYYRHNPESLTHSKRIKPYTTALSEFKHLFFSVQKYIEKYNIPESERVFRKKQNAARLLSVLGNIYHHNMSRKERLLHLKGDYSDHEISVITYLYVPILKKYILYLYMNKHYILFDYIMNIFYHLKDKLANR